MAVAVGTPNLVEAASAKNTLGGDVLLIVGRDYDKLKHRFDLVPRPTGLPPSTSTTSTTVEAPVSTTTTTVARPIVDTRFVPVDPKTGAALVGCPLEVTRARSVNVLSPRAFLHRLITAFVIAVVVSTVAVAGAYAEAARKVSKVAKVADRRLGAPVGRQLPADRLRLARVRQRRPGRAALRQRAAADRAAVRHDHGRAHRREDGHRRCSCRSRAICGSRSRASAAPRSTPRSTPARSA